jgi:hypothetical protein
MLASPVKKKWKGDFTTYASWQAIDLRRLPHAPRSGSAQKSLETGYISLPWQINEIFSSG